MIDTQNKYENLEILKIDPYLEPHREDLKKRMLRYSFEKNKMLGNCSSISEFANGHHYYGFHCVDDGWYYREWAPGAENVWLTGDFNNWDLYSHPLESLGNGNWQIFIKGKNILKHMSKVKVRIKSNGYEMNRIPLYIKRSVQDEITKDFSGQIWNTETEFNWTDENFNIPVDRPLLIYETHIGIAQESEKVGSFSEFTNNILPRIKKNGYNTIQLMAVMEHPYYGSFGYQVSNFFAISSRFGTPEELKSLINTAHSMGITVLLDIIHSHSVKNHLEGINKFDGTDYQFFHSGEKGNHPAWNTKLFNYGKHEVLHFLLSNLKFYLEEYHFDGFRFDGVTSMLYHHRGLGTAFNDYSKYFSMDTDVEAITYLQFANELIHEINSSAITIAEDMSGMPGMCLPIEYGGIGFDYRLSMGTPDLWIKLLKTTRDEDWNMWNLWHELTTRRPQEKNIGYVESHDQALVGDKTIMFWLADKEMYWHMSDNDDNMVINRAMSLHKMIRFLTMTLAGEGYLNFMGNEFGHPEWIDFPREGNNWSYYYARRQWSLVDSEDLKYKYLIEFDKAMLNFVKENNILNAQDLKNLWIDNDANIIVYKKGGKIFIFNFHPNNSFENYQIPVDSKGSYKVIFNTDESTFKGFSRVSKDVIYKTTNHTENMDKISLYLPCRTSIVLEKIND
ncbi:MAG: alpha amylase C-terminal domain-containing protein [Clostridiales bacterium]